MPAAVLQVVIFPPARDARSGPACGQAWETGSADDHGLSFVRALREWRSASGAAPQRRRERACSTGVRSNHHPSPVPTHYEFSFPIECRVSGCLSGDQPRELFSDAPGMQRGQLPSARSAASDGSFWRSLQPGERPVAQFIQSECAAQSLRYSPTGPDAARVPGSSDCLVWLNRHAASAGMVSPGVLSTESPVNANCRRRSSARIGRKCRNSRVSMLTLPGEGSGPALPQSGDVACGSA